MITAPITSEVLASSVIAVPPLARGADYKIDRSENAKIIRHMESGGIKSLLYGGNALLGHVSISEYGSLLAMLVECVAKDTLVVPSVGPGFGLMMDQAGILKDFPFPTAMLLPTNDPTTPLGIARALRLFVERVGRPAVLYIKQENYVDVATVVNLVKDGVLSYIKYAVVRKEPREDPFLRSLINAVGSNLVVSGMGEQPAVVHMRDFGLVGFTAGIVCITPKLSMEMLRSIHAREYDRAEAIRSKLMPLELLRDKISPVQVLHAAVELAGIAKTGPVLPPQSCVSEEDRKAICKAVDDLLK